MSDHEVLIKQLSRAAKPVKRTAAVWRRVLVWIALALPAGALFSLLAQRALTDWQQPGAFWAVIELLLTLCIGTLAVVRTFTLSIAGRKSLRWQIFIPLVAAWLLVNVISMSEGHQPLGNIGDGTPCYTFMMLAGTPMVLLMLTALRRTRTLHPVRTLLMAGVGIAFMALSLLALCHPVHGDFPDFVMHIAAIFTLIGATILAGFRWVAVG
ncbi:NrsF family protein [Pantoea sp. A4]|uniref:NrsF family protein n=1 Tax=Pantoea sp. A4 TaxID=1225184 RepID=UPI000370AD6F|nr:NrsF family protein [Pantoea sp. A4]